jgi:hypothetical protein
MAYKKFKAGTVLKINQGGKGWAHTTGHEAIVVSSKELKGATVEGLSNRTDDVFFVRIDEPIRELVAEGKEIHGENDEVIEVIDDEYATIYDSGSIWAISMESKNADVEVVKEVKKSKSMIELDGEELKAFTNADGNSIMIQELYKDDENKNQIARVYLDKKQLLQLAEWVKENDEA